MNHRLNNFPFWLLTLALFTFLVPRTLFRDGMFMDGLLYASVSKNLADGKGSFWFPHFSKTGHSQWLEQPPLMYGLESVFFRVLGNGIYSERFYTLLTALLCILLISSIWKLVHRDHHEFRPLSWYPVMLWIGVPICFWSFNNNMEENTMSVFTLGACYCIYKAAAGNAYRIRFTLMGSVLLFLASLTKGFQGLFLLSGFFMYWLATRRISFRIMAIHSALLFMVPVTIFTILCLNDDIYRALSTYMDRRVIHFVLHVSSVDNRLYLLYRLFCELIPPLLLCILLLAVFRFSKIPNHWPKEYLGTAFWFLLVGISASFPLMVTREQKGFYLVTSFPYYAIFLAMLTAPGLSILISRLLDKKRLRNLLIAGFSLAMITGIIITVVQAGSPRRDHEMLHDVHLAGKIIPEGEIISIPHALYDTWLLHGYFCRHYYISLSTESDRSYYFCEKTDTMIPAGFRKLPLESLHFDLYAKLNSP